MSTVTRHGMREKDEVMRRNARIRSNLVVIAALCVVATPSVATATQRQMASAPVVQAPSLVKRTINNTVALGEFGFSQGSSLVWESDDLLARDLDGMVAAGATWVGVDVDWPHIQAGGPNSWQWQYTDRVVLAARARGLEVLATADYSPVWARPANTTDKHAPNDPADFARFAAAAAARYAPHGVDAWQIWNEPNIADFWQPQPDANAYSALLIAGADAIHAANPKAVVMNGGLAPAGNVGGVSIAPNDFVVQMYLAGISGHVDAISMHPYSFPYSPTTPEVWNPFYMLTYTHLIMSAFGDGALPIWGTEAGFGTGRDGQSVSQALQSIRMTQVVQAWQQLPFAGNLFIYGYRDLAAGSSSVWDNMGLVRHDFSAKPAAAAFRSAVVGNQPKVRAPRSCIRATPIGGATRRKGC